MSVRATRLLRLLELLREQRRPVTGAWLAERLGIHVRTLYRDIATLREQGAEIEGDAGVGFVLRPGYLLPALSFGEDELEALVMGARWVARQADSELGEAAGRAVNRILATLPERLRLALDTSGLLVPPETQRIDAPWLPVLRRGIREEHALQMRYTDAEGQVTDRTIWPFAMAFMGGVGMIAAWCETRSDFRHFRADRVQHLADSGARYPSRRHVLIARWRDATGYH